MRWEEEEEEGRPGVDERARYERGWERGMLVRGGARMLREHLSASGHG